MQFLAQDKSGEKRKIKGCLLIRKVSVHHFQSKIRDKEKKEKQDLKQTENKNKQNTNNTSPV